MAEKLSVSMISAEYAAGFFDGEGCISCYRNHNPSQSAYHISVILTNGNKDVLQSINEKYGGRIYKQVSKNNNHRDAFHLSFTNHQSMLDFLISIFPFLIVKKKAVGLAIMYLKLRAPKRQFKGNGIGRYGRDYSEKEIALLEKIKEELAMNSNKGRRMK